MRRAFLFTLLLALTPGCKQSEGERCQIDDDCEGGLQCSDSQHICVGMAGSTPDGMPVADARQDGPTPDGSVDAPPGDGGTDAPPDGILPDVL